MPHDSTAAVVTWPNGGVMETGCQRLCLMLTGTIRVRLTVLTWGCVAAEALSPAFSHWHPDTLWVVASMHGTSPEWERFTSLLGSVSWLPALGFSHVLWDYLPLKLWRIQTCTVGFSFSRIPVALVLCSLEEVDLWAIIFSLCHSFLKKFFLPYEKF